jgi:hypothetical protein
VIRIDPPSVPLGGIKMTVSTSEGPVVTVALGIELKGLTLVATFGIWRSGGVIVSISTSFAKRY